MICLFNIISASHPLFLYKWQLIHYTYYFHHYGMLVLLLRSSELLDGITRSVFDLRIYLSDISADNPDTQKLDTAEKPD